MLTGKNVRKVLVWKRLKKHWKSNKGFPPICYVWTIYVCCNQLIIQTYSRSTKKAQRFEIHYTRLGTSIKRSLHQAWIQYQAAHQELWNYTMPCKWAYFHPKNSSKSPSPLWWILKLLRFSVNLLYSNIFHMLLLQ